MIAIGRQRVDNCKFSYSTFLPIDYCQLHIDSNESFLHKK
jgi:hypothetical protein